MDNREPASFSVNRRNYGHWDFVTREKGRVYKIRGGPGCYKAMDERTHPYPVFTFKTLPAAVAFICDQLMFELIIADGQKPAIIEDWNVPESTSPERTPNVEHS